MKQWYEALFENYGKKYDNECFAQGTIGECDFIEKEIVILDRSSNDGEEYFMSKHDIDKLNDSMNKLASDLKQAVID